MAADCILLKPALKFLEGQDQEDRRQICHVLDSICDDPTVDCINKFYFPAPPAIFRICKNAVWWVLYYTQSDNSIRIVNVGRVPERPDIRR